MNELDFKQLSSVYYIYEDLTPNKLWKTYVAFCNDSDIMQPVILKEMDKKRAYIYQSLSGMWNPYIANVYSVHHLPNSKIDDGKQLNDVYIAITENVGNISLSDYVHQNGPLNLNEALLICTQICEGLSDFHKRGYIHRDIKPDNIMMYSCEPNNLHIKIIDLGGAKEIQENKTADTTVIGTIGYQAPESLSAVTKESADIFSIGCVLNFMLTGQEPGIQQYVENNTIVSIIEKATNVDPSSRYSSVDELKKVLLHELRFHRLDRIPVIRSIPGFRTHTYWKMVISSFVYITLLCALITQWMQKIYLESFEMLFYYLIIPLIMICNLGNLLRFIPKNIRNNSKNFFLLRVVCVIIAFFIPIIRIAFFT